MNIREVTCAGVRVEGRENLIPNPRTPAGIGAVSPEAMEIVTGLIDKGKLRTYQLTAAGLERAQAKRRLDALRQGGLEEYIRKHGYDPESVEGFTREGLENSYNQDVADLEAQATPPQNGRGRPSAHPDEIPREPSDVVAEIWDTYGGCLVRTDDESFLAPEFATDVGRIRPGMKMRRIASSSDLNAWMHDKSIFGEGANRGWDMGEKDPRLGVIFRNLVKDAKEIAGVAKDPTYPPLDDKFHVCELEGAATPAEVARGKMLAQEFIERFSFVKPEAGKPHTNKFVFTGYLGTVFWGGPAAQRPAFVIDSETGAFAGKTKAGESPSWILTEGPRANVSGNVSEPGKKEELKKELAFRKNNGEDVKLFGLDNLRPGGMLSDPDLASFLTSEQIMVRQVYGKSMPKGANTLTVWMTMNEDPQLSRELASRCVGFTMAEVPEEEKDDYWEAKMKAFGKENGRLIRAAFLDALKKTCGTKSKAKVKWFRYPEWQQEVLRAAICEIWDQPESVFVEVCDELAAKRKALDSSEEVVRRVGGALERMIMHGIELTSVRRPKTSQQKYERDQKVASWDCYVYYIENDAVRRAAMEAGYHGEVARTKAAEFDEAVKGGNAGRFRRNVACRKIPSGTRWSDKPDRESPVPCGMSGLVYWGSKAKEVEEVCPVTLEQKADANGKKEWVLKRLGLVRFKAATDTKPKDEDANWFDFPDDSREAKDDKADEAEVDEPEVAETTSETVVVEAEHDGHRESEARRDYARECMEWHRDQLHHRKMEEEARMIAEAKAKESESSGNRMSPGEWLQRYRAEKEEA